jgi:hypothetical protein
LTKASLRAPFFPAQSSIENYPAPYWLDIPLCVSFSGEKNAEAIGFQSDEIAWLVVRRVLCIVVRGALVFRVSVCLCRGGYVDQAIHQAIVEGGSDRRGESRKGGRVCSRSGGRESHAYQASVREISGGHST